MLSEQQGKPIVTLSGIRGVVNVDLSPTYASMIGRKFGAYLKSGTVAVARDTRTSSLMIMSSFISGLLESNCSVFDLGFSSTPSVFKEVAIRKLDGGAMITASHNPPEWNGMKLIAKGGRGIFEDELVEIQGMESLPPANGYGRVYARRALYYEILAARAGKASAKSVRVAIDLAGGVGSLFIPHLLSFQGCEVHSIHDTPGIFPRTIDPTSDPLIALSSIVRNNECSAGFAYDCDADRLVMVDEGGRKLSGDATLLICLRYFLENTRNRNVAVSVDTSLAVEDLIREYNGKIIYAKVGEANVLRKIVENSCGAGGEGSSGGYIEPTFVMCRDGVYATTIITRMMAHEGGLSRLLSGFHTYFQARGKLPIEKNAFRKILEMLSKTEGEVDLTDGVKIRKNDRSWVLLRPSNTENVIRVSAEATSQVRADELVAKYSDVILEIAHAAK